jgi:hypothetical protein
MPAAPPAWDLAARGVSENITAGRRILERTTGQQTARSGGENISKSHA